MMTQISNGLEGCGIIYVATGKKFIQMAMQSARSCREFLPEIKIHLFADWKSLGFHFETNCQPFTSVFNIEKPHSRSKIDYMPLTPFDRTLFLDADTYALGEISDLFDLLDKFDMALSHAHLRASRLKTWKTVIPESYPQFNSGVVLYKKTQEVIKILNDWKIAYEQAGFDTDQVTLRELLWSSTIRLATLPPEYNIGNIKYFFTWNKREVQPKILHLHFHRKKLLTCWLPFIKFLVKNWNFKLYP